MTWRRFLDALGRTFFYAVFLIASIYSLLAYIPFTDQQVVRGKLFPWLTAFARFFPLLYWLALAAAVFSILPSLRDPRTRNFTRAFVAFFGFTGLVVLIGTPLERLQNNGWSLLLSLAFLLPIIGLSAIEAIGFWNSFEWASSLEGEEQHVFFTAVLTALLLALIYLLIIFTRHALGWTPGLDWKFWPTYLAWTFGSHIFLFIILFIVLDFITAVSHLRLEPLKTEFFLLLTLAVVVWGEVISKMVFQALSFTGFLATLTAFAFGAAMIFAGASVSLMLRRTDPSPIVSGFELLIFPIWILRRAPKSYRICFVLLIPGLAYFLAIESGTMDWGFLGQQLWVIFIWGLTFATFYALWPRRSPSVSKWAFYAMALFIFLGYLTLLSGQRALRATALALSKEQNTGLHEFADFDVSFRVAHEFLTGSTGSGRTRAGSQFYAFLIENADVPESAHIKPVPVRLDGSLSDLRGTKPNIFIIVVDSLRRDYVSAYNPAVWFTPEMGAFARDSIVMKNAFTQYGGTALSEPCIWAGAQLLHEEYTKPFYPMNALDQLLEADHYQSYVSVDSILSVILDPSFPKNQLDQGRGTMNLRLGPTLHELETRLSEGPLPSRPIFFYTQSQNIHVSVINREGRSVPPGWSSPGFDPAVSSRLSKVDKAFGQFISFLKAKGLYNNSIVILTADHGDDLGEGGRWGHAYYIFPEIVRVPLIVHLPPAIKSRLWYDPEAVTFLTDITPSLYYLLGHHRIARNGIYGRPLFTADESEQAPYLRRSYLEVSSYGPVYGILRGASRLYIADAINYRDYLFDLKGTGPDGSPLPLNAMQRSHYRAEIIHDILAVDHHYGFNPTDPPPPH